MQACSGKGGPSRTRLSPLRLLRQVLVVGALLAATKLLTTAPCGDNGDRAPSVALLTAHPGTINDFNYVAQQLGLDVTISDGYRGIPGLKAYVISREDALGVWSSLGQLYCKHYDAIVISDTVPAGGRPFLEAFTRIPGLPDKCRARRVVMHVTNRFDFGNYGDASFYETVQASLAVDKIRWAQNNPYEEFYMTRRNITFARPLPVLRPQGFLPQGVVFRDAGPIPDPDPALPVAVDNPDRPIIKMLHRLMQAQKITYKTVQHRRYGGPSGLAKYKCLIDVPYQVSTMALYENLAAGVPYLIPSPQLLALWVDGKADADGEQHDFPGDGSGVASLGSPDFPLDRMDFYNDFAKDVVFTFDSWDDLRHKLETVDFDAARRKAVEKMNRLREQTIAGWKDILGL